MKKTGPKKTKAEPRLSRQHPPADLPVAEWQRKLRQQFGQEQSFNIENLGASPVYSEFAVTNPTSGRSYRVAIRGAQTGENYCACPDFATNLLGTCKHIEFTLARIALKRGGKKALRQGFHPTFSEIFLDYAGQRRVRLRLGGECPATVRNKASKLFLPQEDWQLPIDRYADLPAFLDAARKAGHVVRSYDDALNFIAEQRDAEHRRRILDAAYPTGARSPALKNIVKVRLYPYQAEGALFAARAGRALLGDEMGLGKTVQAIAAAELLARHFGIERVLIVCPTSLKHQWQREFTRFTAREATVIGGLRAARQALYAADGLCKITNYDTLARDLDLIQAWRPDLVIVDEAQRIKNWHTIAARALKRIECPYAFVLTGTPLENRLEELISIVQFVDQHRLGPTWRLLHEHQQRDDHGRVIGYRNLDQIGRTLAPIMLRRRKAEVLDQLPARVDNTFFVPLTAEQRAHHTENGDIVARIVSRWRRTGFLSEVDRTRLTCALQNMRMACNSTYLLDQTTDFGHKADELIVLLEDMFEQPTTKVVVFSQWVRTHELIVRRLQSRSWGHVLFHGGIPAEKRGALVARFHSDPDCRIFLSTDAGGVGLNLQHAAACVVNMDLPWNPAVLEQRIGRVHRLGQSKSVQVINFVAQGSIEEGMLSVLAFKKSLFEGVLDGGESSISLEGSRLSKFMDSVATVTGATGTIETAPAAQTAIPEAPTPDEDTPLRPTDLSPETSPPPPQSPWTPLLQITQQLVQELTAAAGATPSKWLATDPSTGQRFLKLPVPEAHTVQRLADALAAFLKG